MSSQVTPTNRRCDVYSLDTQGGGRLVAVAAAAARIPTTLRLHADPGATSVRMAGQFGLLVRTRP